MPNMIKRFLLLAGLVTLFGWAGWMLGGQAWMIIALLIAAAANPGSCWYSDQWVLRMYGAKPMQSVCYPAQYG